VFQLDVISLVTFPGLASIQVDVIGVMEVESKNMHLIAINTVTTYYYFILG